MAVKYCDIRVYQRKGDNGGTVCKFMKTVDKRTLVVVAERGPKDVCTLLTAYYED